MCSPTKLNHVILIQFIITILCLISFATLIKGQEDLEDRLPYIWEACEEFDLKILTPVERQGWAKIERPTCDAQMSVSTAFKIAHYGSKDFSGMHLNHVLAYNFIYHEILRD